MIPKLRNQHRYTWMVLAILLPLGFVAAFLAVPPAPEFVGIDKGVPEPYPEVVFQQKNEVMEAALRQNEEQAYQLEIKLLQPLTLPFVRVYVHQNKGFDPRATQALGQLGAIGTYRFDLSTAAEAPLFVTVYDPFKKVPLITLPLS